MKLPLFLRSTFIVAAISSYSLSEAAISPARLEANLGPMPFDVYSTAYSESQYNVFPDAHTTGCLGSVRSCGASIIAGYALQGVTGIRFQFALQGGSLIINGSSHPSYSTPFDSHGNISSTWLSNLSSFFSDLKTNGITKVTPTATLYYYWSGTLQPTQVTYPGGGCPTWTKTLYFFPWLPFGLDANDHAPNYPQFMFPDGRKDPSGNWLTQQQANQAYFCSPKNPNFWGWTPFFNLVDQIAAQAQAIGITIEEFEIESEPDIENFTLLGRLVYDNNPSNPTAVRQTVAQKLTNHGYNGAAATYGVQTIQPTSAAYDCNSLYGDSAHLLPSSELLGSTGAAQIGLPLYINPSATGGLPCDTSMQNPPPNGCKGLSGQQWATCVTKNMISIPTQSTPAFTDVHLYPCIVTGAGGSCTSSDATTTAQDMFTDVWNYLVYRGLTASPAMIGEIWSNTLNSACGEGGNPQQLAPQAVTGYGSSTLKSNDQANVVFRPWAFAMDSTCPVPTSIGKPSGPYAP